ncbi:MAG: nicotinate-nucleotide adenylyltransferase [Bacteroidales bacterium]|nr:nicotinate-nucleotide adenylyltransferase [Bacteroidales bacterium]
MKPLEGKTGLYFGSFNPIHVGHLAIASAVLDEAGLREVWFVLSPQNPFKEQKNLLPDHHRLQILKVAIEDNPRFRACDIEFSLPRPSYTSLTLAHLAERYPEKAFCLIMGSDNLASFHRWRNYQSIIDNYHICVYPRVDSPKTQWDDHPHVHLINSPLFNISSSYIRDCIKNGKSVKYILTEPALKYVEEMNFYK